MTIVRYLFLAACGGGGAFGALHVLRTAIANNFSGVDVSVADGGVLVLGPVAILGALLGAFVGAILIPGRR